MSHLRFTAAEYKAVAGVCRHINLAHYDLPTFRLVLALSLADHSPALADRVRRLGQEEIRLLYEHLRPAARNPFNPEEWLEFGKACGLVPSTHRFAPLVQRVVVQQLRPASPGLSRKLSRMSVSKFARLYEEVRGV